MELPKTCLVDRSIPKKTFYEKVNISNSIKEEFIENIRFQKIQYIFLKQKKLKK